MKEARFEYMSPIPTAPKKAEASMLSAAWTLMNAATEFRGDRDGAAAFKQLLSARMDIDDAIHAVDGNYRLNLDADYTAALKDRYDAGLEQFIDGEA